jgi:hypothetical protein
MFDDLNFDLDSDEVWEELSSHNEKKFETVSSTAPIHIVLLENLEQLGRWLSKQSGMRFNLPKV